MSASSLESLCSSLGLRASGTFNTTTLLEPLRDCCFAVDALAPRICSLQQCVLLLFLVFGNSLPLRFVGGLQRHCVILWAVSTLTAKAFIAASRHSVVLWVVQHRWAIACRLSLAGVVIVTRYFPSRVLMTLVSFCHA